MVSSYFSYINKQPTHHRLTHDRTFFSLLSNRHHKFPSLCLSLCLSLIHKLILHRVRQSAVVFFFLLFFLFFSPSHFFSTLESTCCLILWALFANGIRQTNKKASARLRLVTTLSVQNTFDNTNNSLQKKKIKEIPCLLL